MSLEKSMLVALTGVLLMAMPVPSQAQIIDKFNGPMINPATWNGNDTAGEPGSSNLEVRRAIVNGQLVLRLTSYGKTDDDTGEGGFANNRLRLNNPAGLTELRARVTVQQAVAQRCQNNSAKGSSPRARIVAAFFNDGSSPGGVNGQVGDIQANLQMIFDSGHGPTPSVSRRFELEVVRCDNSDCSSGHTIGSVGFPNTTWAIGQAVPIKLLLDKTNNKVFGTVNRGLPSEEVQFVSYGVLSDVDDPGGDLKELIVTTVEANCTAAPTMSQITALFDNFFAQ